jgi:glycerol-3-phosphate acyltransferase PlsY
MDIRRYGSGNVGAANIFTTASKWISIIVVLFDLGKGMLPVYIARLVNLQLDQQIIVGLAVIAGHNWTVFLRFSGGRGILTTLGVLFMFTPWLAIVLTAFAFAWLPFKQFAFGTFLSLLLLPIFSWFLPKLFGIEQSLTLTLGFVAMLLLAILRRLTAPRTAVTASVPQGELIVNRLLFDRDIRDRAAWIRRTPTDASPQEESGEEKQAKS